MTPMGAIRRNFRSSIPYKFDKLWAVALLGPLAKVKAQVWVYGGEGKCEYQYGPKRTTKEWKNFCFQSPICISFVSPKCDAPERKEFSRNFARRNFDRAHIYLLKIVEKVREGFRFRVMSSTIPLFFCIFMFSILVLVFPLPLFHVVGFLFSATPGQKA